MGARYTAYTERIRRIPFPVRVVTFLLSLTLVGRFFGKTWFGAFATALIFLLIGGVAAGLGLLRRRSHPSGG